MKYRAVIFDLFGTLVDNFSRREYESVVAQMAEVLSAPPSDFMRLWFDIGDLRTKGVLQSWDANIEHIYRKLGLRPQEDRRKLAARIRSDYGRHTIVARADATDVLSLLRSAGHRIGLISDCSCDTPAVWEETPLAPLVDAAVFSCLAGVKKPDPRVYLLATEQLAVRPEECLYVGDGSSHELTGASRVGMHPVLIRVSYEDTSDAARIDEEEWDGTTISSLTEVLPLVE